MLGQPFAVGQTMCSVRSGVVALLHNMVASSDLQWLQRIKRCMCGFPNRQLRGPRSCRLTTHIMLTGTMVALCLQVFDDKNQFAEWFGDSFGKTAPGAGGEDEVAMEKRVVVIHRLHQILEPFMLRRQVQDVEGKLPPKVLPQKLHLGSFLGQRHAAS